MTKDYRTLTTWWRHRKTKTLIRLLGFEGPFRLHALWSYATEMRPDGRLTGLTPRDIADECDWSGDPETLISALIEARWIDRDGDTLVLHDWREHNAYVVHGPERSERSRELAIQRWEKKRGGKRKNAEPNAARMPDASAAHAQRNGPVPAPVPGPDPDPDPSPVPPYPPADSAQPAEPPPPRRPRRQGTAGDGFRSLAETAEGTATAVDPAGEFRVGLSALVRCDKALKSVCEKLDDRGGGKLRDELMQRVLPRGIDPATNTPRLSVPGDLHARISDFLATPAMEDLTGIRRIFGEWFVTEPQEAAR